MLHHITEDGHLHWKCPDCPPDSEHNTAHISHDEVEYVTPMDGTTPTMVALPRCDCGSRTFLKVAFTEAELQELRAKQHPALGYHLELARQLKAVGKHHNHS